MTRMYFSGLDSSQSIQSEAEDILKKIDDPKIATRFVLDSHLLRIKTNKVPEAPQNNNFIFDGSDSFALDVAPSWRHLAYGTNKLIRATFQETTSEKFKEMYLRPLFAVIQVAEYPQRPMNIDRYECSHPSHMASTIDECFKSTVIYPIGKLYRSTGRVARLFGDIKIRRPRKSTEDGIIKPDITHLRWPKFEAAQEFCCGIGSYMEPKYELKEGFEKMLNAIEKFKDLEKNGNTSTTLFKDGDWDQGILFTLILRKYIYEALLCGTNRIFISGYQTFSGFFTFDVDTEDETKIEYFVIDDPETNGYNAAMDIECPSDPLVNVLPRLGKGILSDTTRICNERTTETEILTGGTYCRIINNAHKRFPDLNLPPTVFAKVYYHDEDFLRGDKFEINTRIANSKYASNFTKLLASGYWYEAIPASDWDFEEVHRVIKQRLQELHSIGISHNDLRYGNIHVSRTGNVSLIDFGLSEITNSKRKKEEDFKTLDYLWDISDSMNEVSYPLP
ncbi:uncharacterized protein RJT20DRAFT_146755 [Scheffersomyces xylosifermentans]|uniref:uncharacterized protein n=1 Tax=Scheffersomyces xylosifermentans TaxID=1304137 RepID=UPI00315D77A3